MTTHKLKLWFKKAGWYLAGEAPTNESLEAYEAFKDIYPKLRAHKRTVCVSGSIIAWWGVPDDEHVRIKFAQRDRLILLITEGPKSAVACFPPAELKKFLKLHHITHDVFKRSYE